MAKEVWQLSQEEATNCLQIMFPNNKSKVHTNPSHDRIKIFTTEQGLTQTDLSLICTGSVLTGGEGCTDFDNKVHRLKEYLKEIEVIGFK